MALVALLFLWMAAGALPWWSEARGAMIARGELDAPGRLLCELDEATARRAGRRLLRLGTPRDVKAADALLACSLRGRPLYAPTWLARAELALRDGQPERARAFLRVATSLWPARPRLLWDAAVLASRLGDREHVFALLRAYLDATGPDEVERALHLTTFVDPRPEAQVNGLFAGTRRIDTEEGLRRILHAAVRRDEPALAEAAWHALPDGGRGRRELVDLYVESALEAGDAERAHAAWQGWRARVGAGDDPLTDGGFESEPGQRGFGWRVQRVAGSDWVRDTRVRRGGAASLRIDFDGSADPAFAHARQVLALEPGRTYRLRGHWRGVDVSGRSGPYLEARPHGGARRFMLPPRVGSWDWEPFDLTFEMPLGRRLVEIRLRRDREGRGRGFSGSVWLDELALERASHG